MFLDCPPLLPQPSLLSGPELRRPLALFSPLAITVDSLHLQYLLNAVFPITEERQGGPRASVLIV